MRILLSWLWRVACVIAAAIAAVIPLPPATVDRWYAAEFYAGLQPWLTSLSNRITISLLDILLTAVVVLWIARAVHDLVHTPSRLRGVGAIAARTIVWSAALYLVFLLLWGFNYRRPRLRESQPYDASVVTADAAAAALRQAVSRLNGLHDRAHANGWPPRGVVDADLASGFARAIREVGITRGVVPARPKQTLLLDWYFRRAGVDGMTDPFFLETLMAGGVLSFEQPFVVAHEWSHLAGIADEGEANFTAWLACAGGSPPNAYSGWLFLYSELARAVTPSDRAANAAALDAGPRADLLAVRRRYQQDVNPRVSDAGWRVYDSYLKANRVEGGTTSYDEVVRLVLGLRLNGQPPLDGR